MKARRAFLRTRTLPARPDSGGPCGSALMAQYEPSGALIASHESQLIVKPPIASIVIPAHNEEAVLARCLRVLLAGSQPGELDVIVVANACTDRTAEIAREAGV